MWLLDKHKVVMCNTMRTTHVAACVEVPVRCHESCVSRSARDAGHVAVSQVLYFTCRAFVTYVVFFRTYTCSKSEIGTVFVGQVEFRTYVDGIDFPSMSVPAAHPNRSPMSVLGRLCKTWGKVSGAGQNSRGVRQFTRFSFLVLCSFI